MPGFIKKKKKRYIVDAWEGSQYSLGFEYTRVLNMPGLDKVF